VKQDARANRQEWRNENTVMGIYVLHDKHEKGDGYCHKYGKEQETTSFS
jgi:hypothetical protein